VEDRDRAVVPDLRQVGEAGPLEAPEGGIGPLLRGAGGGAGEGVHADPDQLALRLCDILGGRAQQGQWGAPGDEPAEIGRELAVQAEVEGAGDVTSRIRGAGPEVDDPLSGLDPRGEGRPVDRL